MRKASAKETTDKGDSATSWPIIPIPTDSKQKNNRDIFPNREAELMGFAGKNYEIDIAPNNSRLTFEQRSHPLSFQSFFNKRL